MRVVQNVFTAITYVRVQLHLQLIHILIITAIINFGVVRDLETTSIAWRSMDGGQQQKKNKCCSGSTTSRATSCAKLENQLRIVVDVIRVELPEVKKVTSIRTICDAMAQHVNKDLLSEVHLLLR